MLTWNRGDFKEYIEQASTILSLSLSSMNVIMADFWKSNTWPVEIQYETKELNVFRIKNLFMYIDSLF